MGKLWDQKKWEDVDDAYVGNIWGWKFSIISLVFILILVGIMIYRHAQIDPSQVDENAVEQIDLIER